MANFNEPSNKSTPEKFWSRVQKGDGCWEWQGALNQGGYGIVGYRGKAFLAHRLAWELTNGSTGRDKNAKGAQSICVCHRCDNRRCCNPSHLFLGTQVDNMNDMRKKGRGVDSRGERGGLAKLTWDKVREIRARHASGESMNSLAKPYGVSYPTIRCIVNRWTWVE